MFPFAAMGPLNLTSTTTGSSSQDADISSTAIPVSHSWNAAGFACAQCRRQHGHNALTYRQPGFENAARQFERAARGQTEMEVARATTRTQADMVADLLRLNWLLNIRFPPGNCHCSI